MMRSSLAALLLFLPATALAQDDGEEAPAEEPTVDETPTEAPQADTAPTPATDGSRRRRGTTLGVGFESVTDGFGNSLTATMGGLDTHFGMQINDLVGVYVPLHLAFGSFPGQGTVAGIPAGLTGTLAVTVVADFTFADRFFVGGGGGLGILNNPMGPAVHLRAGGYPLMKRREDGPRRQGLVTALDLRMIYAKGGGQAYNAVYPMFTVGYASF